MNTILSIAGCAHDLVQEGAQRLIDNPMIVFGIAAFAFSAAVLAGFIF